MARFDKNIYDSLCYPGDEPRVLVNKLGIKDGLSLEKAELSFVERQLKKGLPDEARELSLDGLKAMHKHMFDDVYDWAGKPRIYTTGRGQAPFAKPEFIEPELNRLFDTLKKENYLKNLEPEKFAERAAYYVNEINAIHPFIEGNGRLQRLFLTELAEQAGHKISLEQANITKAEWYKASEEGFYISNDKMVKLIERTINSPTIRQDIDLIPAQTLESLSAAALAEHVSENGNVKSLRENVEQLAKLVYGRPDALNKDLASIGRNPKMSETLANRIETAPETVTPLAGSQSLLGKDATRKTAEANIYKLGQAIEDYGNAVRRASEEITQAHEKEQKRMAQSVPQPDKGIKQLLNMSAEQRKEVLEKSPQLQEELQSFVDRLHNRLAPDERKAMIEGNHAQLAKSLGVSEAQAKQIGTTANTAKTVQQSMTRTTPVRVLSK